MANIFSMNNERSVNIEECDNGFVVRTWAGHSDNSTRVASDIPTALDLAQAFFNSPKTPRNVPGTIGATNINTNGPAGITPAASTDEANGTSVL